MINLQIIGVPEKESLFKEIMAGELPKSRDRFRCPSSWRT